VGYKKEGFGAGNHSPFTGPIADGEDGPTVAKRDLLVRSQSLIAHTTANTRRLKQQTGVEAEDVEFKGAIRVVLGGMKESLHCSMYKVKKWKGQPKERVPRAQFKFYYHKYHMAERAPWFQSGLLIKSRTPRCSTTTSTGPRSSARSPRSKKFTGRVDFD
jgi:hypothetical protein